MTTTPEPFSVSITDAVIDDLKRRVAATRWPDDPDNDDWSYGVNAAYLRGLEDYWQSEFNWRSIEVRINSYPNFRVALDGVPVHFIHKKGSGENRFPLILTHGWPWSFWDMPKSLIRLSIRRLTEATQRTHSTSLYRRY